MTSLEAQLQTVREEADRVRAFGEEEAEKARSSQVKREIFG